MMSESVESFGYRLKGPSEVITNINRLISNAVGRAEKVLKKLENEANEQKQKRKKLHNKEKPIEFEYHSTNSTNSITPSESIQHTPDSIDDISSANSLTVIRNQRKGVTFVYRDRIFENGDKTLLTREIWPSDGGTIELDRQKLDQLIGKNEKVKQRHAKIEKEIKRSEAGRTPQQYYRFMDETIETLRKSPNAKIDHFECSEHSSANLKRSETLIDSNIDSFETTLSSLTETLKTVKSDTSTNSKDESIMCASYEAGDSHIQHKYCPKLSMHNGAIAESNSTNINDYAVTSQKLVVPGLIRINDFAELFGLNLELSVLVGHEEQNAREITLQVECVNFKQNISKMRKFSNSI